MQKIKFIKVFIFIILVISLCALCACTNSPADYVEVESLRIESANVYLSPSGETAKKQLEVEILPSNATNRKLIYYIPSEYLKYATVSETGLISALLTTEEDMKVPLIVKSSTNPKASLQINLVVEYVEVKEVNFTEDIVDLLYKSAGRQLYVSYQPYHAQDGRAVTYSSLNENVATVTSSGVVNAVDVGSTHIMATCKISTGKAVQGRIPVKVNYAKGRYRLEVSDTTPQFNQVLGNFKAINFNLMILEEQSDPNPRIQWYVDSERVIGLDSYTQYEHIPSVSTECSYNVSVKVTPYKEKEQELISPLIEVFNIFRGFEFHIENITNTGKGYQYGDTVTFPLTISSAGIVKYEWYLKKRNATGKGVFVGETPVSNKDLQKRLNLEGDFTLTAEGMDSLGNTISTGQIFNFSVTRFNVGDTLIINPKLLEQGMPPESYNWYKHEVDENGNRISELSVGSSVYGEPFYYSLASNNRIELTAKAMLEGRVATVDGEEFEGSTGAIRVYGSSLDSEYIDDIINVNNSDFHYIVTNTQKVDNIVIEGVNVKEENLVNIHWSPTSNAPSYVVEISKKGGNVCLLDSAVEDFGDYYVYVPRDIVTLDDSFTVRVKQKGGLFSERYYYNHIGERSTGDEFYFDKIDSIYYDYLGNISGNMNRYVQSMRELGEILDYIMLFVPRSNPFIIHGAEGSEDITYDTFTTRLRINIDYTQEIADLYPVTVEEGAVSNEYLELYKMLLGVQKSYCETGEYRLRLDTHDDDTTYSVTVMKPVIEMQVKSTDDIDFVAGDSVYYATNPYGDTITYFAIDLREQVRVYTSDQLYTVAKQGKCPIPDNDALSILYGKAKSVVKNIIEEGMTDRQKVLAFYDYLTTNIIYDTQIKDLIDNNTETLFSAYNYDSFHLEGVFNNSKAVCDGIAKAMSLLCAIEGIYCEKVTGTIDGIGHSWNKILLDDNYYYLDATYGIKSIKKQDTFYQYTNHKYFLMTDSQFINYYVNPVIFGEYPKSGDEYDFYSTKVNDISITVSSQEDLKNLLDSFGENVETKIYLEIKVSDSYLEDSTIEQLLTDLTLSGGKLIFEHLSLSENRLIIVLH